MPELDLPPARYEHSDVDVRLIHAGLAALLFVLAICALGAIWLFPGITADTHLGLPLPEYPSPRLQVDPHADMQAFLQQEMAQLNSSGWVDRSKGIAHIPIDEAMRRIVAQGIPDWPGRKGTQR